MEKITINNEMLGFVFQRLRHQEGLEKGRVSSILTNELIFKILINAKFKTERSMILTDLEKTVMKESGNYITMYVAQKWEEAKSKSRFVEIPYPELSHKTIRDCETLIKRKTLVKTIA